MPGVSIWLSNAEQDGGGSRGGHSVGLKTRKTAIHSALDTVEHTAEYDCEFLLDRADGTIAWTGYPSYPVRVVEDETYVCCFEGKSYNKKLDRDHLLTIADRALTGDRRWLESLIETTDGEFVCYAFEKETGALAVVNDAFGRLPVYVSERDSVVSISREIQVLLDWFDDLDIDDVGIAQSLAFGFTIGDRTLWEGIKKLDGGSLLQYHPETGVTRNRLHWFDFDTEDNSATGKTDERSIEENAQAVAESFAAACKRRGSELSTTVVSLSGGHDSRAVAAGYRKSGQSFSTATFATAGGGNAVDVRVARETAEALDVDWQQFELSRPGTPEIRTLLSLKAGMNPFTNAAMVEFLQSLHAETGSDVTYVTGDGGDKAIPDLSPSKSLDDVADLVSYLAEKETIVFPLDRVETMTDVSAATLRETLRRRVESYPESTPAGKYIGYKVRERGFNWLNEGEDRNRAFFWSTTPFYSLPFFREAMQVPPAQKSDNQFYRAFLEELWPGALRIQDANFRLPMSSPLYPLLQRGLAFLGAHPKIEDLVRLFYRRELLAEYDEDVARLLAAQGRDCEALTSHFNQVKLHEIITDRQSCTSQQAYNLLTMTSVVAALKCGTPSFEAVPDATLS